METISDTAWMKKKLKRGSPGTLGGNHTLLFCNKMTPKDHLALVFLTFSIPSLLLFFLSPLSYEGRDLMETSSLGLNVSGSLTLCKSECGSLYLFHPLAGESFSDDGRTRRVKDFKSRKVLRTPRKQGLLQSTRSTHIRTQRLRKHPQGLRVSSPEEAPELKDVDACPPS